MNKPFLRCALALLIACGCANDSAQKASVKSKFAMPEQVARELASASPIAHPGDVRARDLAAQKLAECESFKTAANQRILWGGCDPAKGFDPRNFSLTEFEPVVWLKLYASTIMFTGEHTVRKDGPLTVLEMKARFRSNLDPGDYPYPFWHSPKKWQAYLDLETLCVVFRQNKIVAVYRVANSDPARPQGTRVWDGKWRWLDGMGNEQPRAALFTYMFGDDNPHRVQVDRSYRELESKFRASNCNACHAPDNQGKAKQLLLLNYPNQALTARHTLVRTLEQNEMPPEDPKTQHPGGISDLAKREELIQAAKTFVQQADAAVAFETSRKAH
jgi:hypothetical protein